MPAPVQALVDGSFVVIHSRAGALTAVKSLRSAPPKQPRFACSGRDCDAHGCWRACLERNEC